MTASRSKISWNRGCLLLVTASLKSEGSMGRAQVMLQSKQVIPVSPEVVRRLDGNVLAAYFYTQLQFYNRFDERDSSGWFTKDSTDIENDTGLSRFRQRRVRELLESKGIIETDSIRGGPKPAIRFRIVVDFTRA